MNKQSEAILVVILFATIFSVGIGAGRDWHQETIEQQKSNKECTDRLMKKYCRIVDDDALGLGHHLVCKQVPPEEYCR